MRVEQCRTQVTEQPQLGANLQQTALGTNGRIDLVPLRASHRAKQNGIGSTCTRKGFVGQRHAIFVDRCATQLVIAQLEVQLELVIGQLQNFDRLGHDLRADTITGQNQNLFTHHIPRFSLGWTPLCSSTETLQVDG